MRAVILILVILILAVIGAIASGFLDINQIRGAQAPEITATRNARTCRPCFASRSTSAWAVAMDSSFEVKRSSSMPQH